MRTTRGGHGLLDGIFLFPNRPRDKGFGVLKKILVSFFSGSSCICCHLSIRPSVFERHAQALGPSSPTGGGGGGGGATFTTSHEMYSVVLI